MSAGTAIQANLIESGRRCRRLVLPARASSCLLARFAVKERVSLRKTPGWTYPAGRHTMAASVNLARVYLKDARALPVKIWVIDGEMPYPEWPDADVVFVLHPPPLD